MIKLTVSDVDGTLMPDGSSDLDPGVFDIILRLREKGMQFVVASGRPWVSVKSVLEPVEKKIFYAANNGVYVNCHGRCLHAYTTNRQLAHRIIRKVRMHPELEMVYAGVNGGYLDSKNDVLYNWLTNGYEFNVIRVRDMLKLEESCVKISIYKKEGVEAATRDIYEEFRDQVKMACAGDIRMDCMARDANKGRVVRAIQESLSIKVEETMAFGDQLNDIEMLNQAYYGFAVTNAREEVRRITRFQTDSNVQSGVLKILKGLLWEERDGGQKQDIQGTGEEVEGDLNTVLDSGPGTNYFYRVFQGDSCDNQLQSRG